MAPKIWAAAKSTHPTGLLANLWHGKLILKVGYISDGRKSLREVQQLYGLNDQLRRTKNAGLFILNSLDGNSLRILTFC